MASTLAGIVLSILPAVVVLLVTLLYNGAGEVLVLLGSLINLLPHPALPSGGSSSLPVFQVLGADTGTVLLRAAVATTLCSASFALLIAPRRTQDRRVWLISGVCCLLAAIVGGRMVAFAVAPAIAASVGGALLRAA